MELLVEPDPRVEKNFGISAAMEAAVELLVEPDPRVGLTEAWLPAPAPGTAASGKKIGHTGRRSWRPGCAGIGPSTEHPGAPSIRCDRVKCY